MEEKTGMSKGKTVWLLFSSMLYISAFTFGGGFVIVTLMKRRFVDELHWLTEQEMLDMTAIAQSAPGAIAVNAAMLVGRQMLGALGLAFAVFGTIIPPIAILSIVSFFYEEFAHNAYVAAVLTGMQAGVAAVIIDVVLNMGGQVLKSRSALSGAIMVGSFIAAYVLKVNVVYLILISALIGTAKALFGKRRQTP